MGVDQVLYLLLYPWLLETCFVCFFVSHPHPHPLHHLDLSCLEPAFSEHLLLVPVFFDLVGCVGLYLLVFVLVFVVLFVRS
jgi:hypothetical protein